MRQKRERGNLENLQNLSFELPFGLYRGTLSREPGWAWITRDTTLHDLGSGGIGAEL